MVNDKIFKFAYLMAFRDATMRNAFTRLDNEVKDKIGDKLFHDRKSMIKDHSKCIVQNYINIIISGEGVQPLSTITSLCDEYNSNHGFSFGNAQKLVNMTAKYMFLSAYGDSEKRLKFEKCHCPMDGIMMYWLERHCVEYGLPMVKFKIPWSKLHISDEESLKEYNIFQYYIAQIAGKENLFPLEVDFKYRDS